MKRRCLHCNVIQRKVRRVHGNLHSIKERALHMSVSLLLEESAQVFRHHVISYPAIFIPTTNTNYHSEERAPLSNALSATVWGHPKALPLKQVVPGQGKASGGGAAGTCWTTSPYLHIASRHKPTQTTALV